MESEVSQWEKKFKDRKREYEKTAQRLGSDDDGLLKGPEMRMREADIGLRGAKRRLTLVKEEINKEKAKQAGERETKTTSGKTAVLPGTLKEQLAVMQAQEEIRNSVSSASPKAIDKSALRYDGKSFDQWCELWQTELNPARRADAVRALAAFSQAGYGRQAAEQIVEVMKQYDPSEDDGSATGELIQAAQKAVASLDAEVGVPVLIKALESENDNSQRFACRALKQYSLNKVRSAVPAMLRLAQDHTATESARSSAIDTVAFLDRSDKRVVDVLGKLTMDESPTVAVKSIQSLVPVRQQMFDGGMRRGNKLVSNANYSPAVTKALRHPDENVRKVAIDALQTLGPKAEAAVPALVEYLLDEQLPYKERREAVSTLATVGQGAVPPLVEALKRDLPIEDQYLVISTLRRIGPPAKKAVPELMELYAADNVPDHLREKYRQVIVNALEGIVEVPETVRLLNEWKQKQILKKKAESADKAKPREETNDKKEDQNP